MQHIAKKVKVNGFTFDSQKEANFYLKFIKNSGYKYEIHPSFLIKDKVALGGVNLTRISYAPDFVIFDDYLLQCFLYEISIFLISFYSKDMFDAELLERKIKEEMRKLEEKELSRSKNDENT